MSPTGEVDYTALRADDRALRSFVGWVAAHGPETDVMRLTDDNLRLAWHLNAINAVVIWSVLEGAPLPDPGSPFSTRRVLLDGEVVRYDRHLLHTVLATYDEPLAVAAIPCGARACPPAAATLYEKKRVDRQLAEQMRRWVRSGRLVRGDGTTFVFSPALRAWMWAFERWNGARTPCDVVAPYTEPPVRERLEACTAWRWDTWDARLDGR